MRRTRHRTLAKAIGLPLKDHLAPLYRAAERLGTWPDRAQARAVNRGELRVVGADTPEAPLWEQARTRIDTLEQRNLARRKARMQVAE